MQGMQLFAFRSRLGHFSGRWYRRSGTSGGRQLLPTVVCAVSLALTALLTAVPAAPAEAASTPGSPAGAIPGALDHGVQWYYLWGQCTWWAALQRPDVGRYMSGNAWWWPNAAEAHGLPTGPDPRVGAVATFQPGIQGASPVVGHVGIVKAVAADGVDFLLSEANFGGGPGVVSDRWASAGPGVRFIY